MPGLQKKIMEFWQWDKRGQVLARGGGALKTNVVKFSEPLGAYMRLITVIHSTIQEAQNKEKSEIGMLQKFNNLPMASGVNSAEFSRLRGSGGFRMERRIRIR